MSDPALVRELLRQVLLATDTILERFKPVHTAKDFAATQAGREKMDSICMQLIVLGEGLKNLDKVTGGGLLVRYPGVDWKKAMGLQDIISHAYPSVDPDVIFQVCRTRVPPLRDLLKRILEEAP
ncbi:MAG TPA: HepT-like ribonuclease domain-containing protein [bacterium]